MVSLEKQLEDAFVDLDVSPENKNSIENHLSLLKRKDQNTYEHSLRVGLLGAKISRHMHLDPKVLFYAGLLHDMGKILIAPETLKKTEGFDEKDMKQMKKHPEYTYRILKGVHEFSAEIALRHHKFQESGYPKNVPKYDAPFSYGSQVMIGFFARILALTDFYDAITSRINDKFGKKEKLSQDKVKSIMLMKNPDQHLLIEDLYVNGLFGETKETYIAEKLQ